MVETPRRRVSTLLAFAFIAFTAASCGEDSPTASTPTPSLTTTTITFASTGGYRIDLLVEVADDSSERARGLMFRESLPEDQGMLFDFGAEATSGFWMKNTTIPLSIAFISADGAVLDIQDLEPLDETLQYAPRPYVYAVEVNQGWFARSGVTIGSELVEAPATPN